MAVAGTSGAVMEDFDVFINHRGPDVKATFAAHLEDALRREGFRPFLDARALVKSNLALKSIDQALAMAKVHVAVVSRGYAESKYCLTELVAMLRSGNPVVPVFYDVEPVDLRRVENGPFAEAFEKHKAKGRSERKLQEWRDALENLAGITGYRLADYKSDEAKLKQEVVNQVALLTPSNHPVEVEPYRVGLERPASTCIQILERMGAGGTRILGLVGMGGIGKTTLAKEIYNRFAAEKKFRHMSFLEIHRGTSTLSSEVQISPTWSRELREQLLRDLLRAQPGCASHDYSSRFRKLSSVGPVLIVVDDVHKVGQFETLIPFASELHPGSRIIVTSRDRGILNNVVGRTRGDHHIFHVSTLDSHRSNELFNWHAFGVVESPNDYRDVAKDVVKACGGLPLALKVIGSSLFDKRMDGDRESIWQEAVDALRQSRDVMDVLRWSYDILPEWEKRMFVDITCIFNYRSADEALLLWKGCKDCASCGGVLTPHTSLQNLINKNLVRRGPQFMTVHDMLVELGREIGRSAKSHFMNGTAAEAALMRKQGSVNTMALNLRGSRKRKFEVEDFECMPNLHYLEMPDGGIVNGNWRCMSRELRWLRWRGASLTSIPGDLDLSRVTSLDFSRSSKLVTFWTESNSEASWPNLVRLNLRACTSITRLPDSIGQSRQLQHLDLVDCEKLKRLPESIGQLKEIEHLDLCGCRSLKSLPDSIGQLSGLLTLKLTYCRELENVPDTIGQLKRLKLLYFNHCKSLKSLPGTIGALSNLKDLEVDGCTSLTTLPASFGLLSSLRFLRLEANIDLQTIPDESTSGEAWTELFWLRVYDCNGLGFFLDYGAFQNLGLLELEDGSLTELPESFGLLMNLFKLRIKCERLQCLPDSLGDLKRLWSLELWDCDELETLPETFGGLTNLWRVMIVRCSGITELPRSLGMLSRLEEFTISRCENIQELLTSIRHLESLKHFEIEDCGSIEEMEPLTTLQGLPIWGNTSITELPASLGFVSTLVACEVKKGAFAYFPFDGPSQVLEEDESGVLEAYQDEADGRTYLLRHSPKERGGSLEN